MFKVTCDSQWYTYFGHFNTNEYISPEKKKFQSRYPLHGADENRYADCNDVPTNTVQSRTLTSSFCRSLGSSRIPTCNARLLQPMQGRKPSTTNGRRGITRGLASKLSEALRNPIMYRRGICRVVDCPYGDWNIVPGNNVTDPSVLKTLLRPQWLRSRNSFYGPADPESLGAV